MPPTGRTDAEAEVAARKAARTRRAIAADGVLDLTGVPLTVKEATELRNDELKALDRSDGTLRAYRSRAQRYANYFGEVPINTWETKRIAEFARALATSKVSPNQFNSLMSTLHSLLLWVARHGFAVEG